MGRNLLNYRKRTSKWDAVESAVDVVQDILSRLPVKCLIPFKTISKLWYKVIGNSNFMKLHLQHSKENPIFILYPYMGAVTDVYLVSASGSVIEEIALPGCENIYFLSMICCHNGLVCFANCPRVLDSNMTEMCVTVLEIRVCNPSTRDVHLLPQGCPSVSVPVVGVAFGLSEYKVFRIFHVDSESRDDDIKCEVYSSSTRTWRDIGSVPKYPMRSHNVYVDGTVYWFIASDDDYEIPGSIFSIDTEEHFRVIELPEEVTAHAFLTDLDGSLCLVAIYDDDFIMDIWLLRSRDGADYWEKKCSDYIPYSTNEDTDTVAGRKNEIFLITTEHYYIYDIERRVWTDLDFEDDFDRNCPAVFSFTESLIPSTGLPANNN